MRLIYRSINIKKILVFIILFLQLNQRPALLQEYGESLFVLICSLLMLYWLLGYRGTIADRKVVFLFVVFVFCVYLWGQVLFLGSVSRSALVNVIFILVSSLSILYLTEETWQAGLKAVVYPVLALSLSYFTTLLIVYSLNIPLPELTWASFGVNQAGNANRYEISIYFPFSISMLLGNFRFGGFELARATGYMREPGIYQILVSVSFFGLDYLPRLRFKTFWKALLGLSLILTFSTAGIGAFLAAATYYYVFARKGVQYTTNYIGLLSTPFILGLGYWFVFTDAKFGLMRKLSFASGTVRVGEAETAAAMFLNNPILGVGYTGGIKTAISFISVIGSIGLLGVILFLIVIVAPNYKKIIRLDPILVLIIPPVLTALLAQPLFDKPLLYIFMALVVSYPRGFHELDPRHHSHASVQPKE